LARRWLSGLARQLRRPTEYPSRRSRLQLCLQQPHDDDFANANRWRFAMTNPQIAYRRTARSLPTIHGGPFGSRSYRTAKPLRPLPSVSRTRLARRPFCIGALFGSPNPAHDKCRKRRCTDRACGLQFPIGLHPLRDRQAALLSKLSESASETSTGIDQTSRANLVFFLHLMLSRWSGLLGRHPPR